MILVPVVLRLLIAWMTGILCADVLTALSVRYMPAAGPSTEWGSSLVTLLFILTLYVAIVVCNVVAHHQSRSPRFATRYASKRWRGAALMLFIVALGVIKARMDMPVGAEGVEHPFVSIASDRNSSTLLPADVITRFRAWCMTCVDSHHPNTSVRGLVQGCLLGDRSGATRRMLLDFNYSGMGHLLAVSGLHLGLISALVWVLFAPLRLMRAHRLSRALLLVLVWGYVLLIGSPPSAVRAAVMLTMFHVAWIVQRTVFGWHNLGVAALALLIYDTRLIYNLSFQLSFTAAVILLFLTQHLADFVGLDDDYHERQLARDHGRPHITLRQRMAWTLGPYFHRLTQMLLFTICLQLGLLPLMLHYFHHVSVMGCLQSFLVLPILGLHLSLLIACLMCHALGVWVPVGATYFDAAANLCWWCVDMGSRWLLTVASWCRTADIRLFGDVTWHLGLWATLGCYIVLVALYLGYRQQRPQWWTVAAGIIVAMILC